MTTRPWKHPKTGIYYLRRAVPADLLARVGKREEKISLGTKDPVRAKGLHASALLDLEERWANLRTGTTVPVTGVSTGNRPAMLELAPRRL